MQFEQIDMRNGTVARVEVRKGDWYFPERWQAVEYAHAALDGTRFAMHYRVREYNRGHAIQLHASGDYLGPATNVSTHDCAWCPRV